MSGLAIDKRSPVPLYFQVERLISQEIFGEVASPGDQLPSEPELAEHFGVSRSVIRQATMRLEQEGLVRRVRGHGTYVTRQEQRRWLLQGVEGFFLQEGGVTSKVLRAEIERLPSWAADALALARGSVGVVLERLRYVDGSLSVYDLNYLPENFGEAVIALKDDPKHSLYEAVTKDHNVSVAYGVRKLDAVLAGERLGRLLEVRASQPLIVIEAVDFDPSFQPFDCYRTWVRPDRVHLEVQVVPAAGQGGREMEDIRGPA